MDHFDAVGVNYYRQSRQDLTDDRYLAKIPQWQAVGKPVVITELGSAACRDPLPLTRMSGHQPDEPWRSQPEPGSWSIGA